MRERIFKAKRKNWKELPKEQWWVEGAIFEGKENSYIITNVKITDEWEDSEIGADVIGYLVDPDTIEPVSPKIQSTNFPSEWIPVSECMPKEDRCIDPETGYYGRSDDVLCSAYNDYEMKYETWIDYTIDGEWQTHEYDEEEKLAWMPLPAPYSEQQEN